MLLGPCKSYTTFNIIIFPTIIYSLYSSYQLKWQACQNMFDQSHSHFRDFVGHFGIPKFQHPDIHSHHLNRQECNTGCRILSPKALFKYLFQHFFDKYKLHFVLILLPHKNLISNKMVLVLFFSCHLFNIFEMYVFYPLFDDLFEKFYIFPFF